MAHPRLLLAKGIAATAPPFPLITKLAPTIYQYSHHSQQPAHRRSIHVTVGSVDGPRQAVHLPLPILELGCNVGKQELVPRIHLLQRLAGVHLLTVRSLHTDVTKNKNLDQNVELVHDPQVIQE